MPILNRPVNSSDEIEGIEYSGETQSDIKKNELCYVQGGANIDIGSISFLNQEFFGYSYVQLDEDRLAIIMIKKLTSTSNPSLDIRLCSFNDGEDKVTNPFINHVTTTLYANFVYNEKYSYSIVKLDIPDREICVFKYGVEVYFFEIINKTENVVFLFKSTSNSVVPLSTSYTEMFPVPYKFVTDDTTYNYIDFCFTGSTQLYITKYSFASSNGKLLNSNQIFITIGNGSDHQLLKVIQLSEYEYIACVAYTGGGSTAKTAITFYLINMDKNTYNPLSTSQLRDGVSSYFTASALMTNFFCYYQENMFVIKGAVSTNLNLSKLFTFNVVKTNGDIGATIQNEIYVISKPEESLSAIYTGEFNLYQHCIIHGNYFASISVSEMGSRYELKIGLRNIDRMLPGDDYSQRILLIVDKTKIKTVQSVIPLVRKNMVYFFYMSVPSSIQLLYCGLLQVDASIYKAQWNNIFNLKQIGLAKDNYAKGETATIIHPTTK